jgi:hypothetical protein
MFRAQMRLAYEDAADADAELADPGRGRLRGAWGKPPPRQVLDLLPEEPLEG